MTTLPRPRTPRAAATPTPPATPIRRRSRAAAAVTGVTLTGLLAAVAPAAGAAPDSPQPEIPASAGPAAPCVPLLGDPVKGYGQFPLGLTPPDFGDAGYDALPPTTLTGLPDRVDLRDSTQGFNQKVEVALADGRLAVRHPGDPQWRDMPTPDCLAGKIRGISVNDDALVALDDDGWIYTMSNLQSSPDRWGWVRAWGGPVWLGDGMQSPTTEPGTWSLSLTGTHTDRTYRTPDGKDQPVSLAKVTQLVALGGDGSHIYSLDPWLAQDYSYEIATPHNGRFRAESVSASGSVVFITDRYGDMYTRLSDYDINGADPAQFRYTWDDDDRPAAPDALTHRLDPRTAPVSLPGDDWTHQPKVPGRITGRISIHSTAPGSENRELRVEGADDAGTTGYWAKALRDETWTFHPTGAPVTGTWLENPPEDRSGDVLAEDSPYSYHGELRPGVGLEIDHFAYAATRHDATLVIGDRRYPLALATVDGRLGTPLSQRLLPVDGEFGARPAGLVDGVPRDYAAAVSVPPETRDAAAHDPELARVLAEDFAGEEHHQLFLRVEPDRMQVINSPVKDVAVPLPGRTAVLPAV